MNPEVESPTTNITRTSKNPQPQATADPDSKRTTQPNLGDVPQIPTAISHQVRRTGQVIVLPVENNRALEDGIDEVPAA